MPQTILIVEDSDIIRKAIRSWLELNFPSNHVLEVDSAEAAISIAKAWALDIILMDIKLPQMNGIEATCSSVTEAAASLRSSSSM